CGLAKTDWSARTLEKIGREADDGVPVQSTRRVRSWAGWLGLGSGAAGSSEQSPFGQDAMPNRINEIHLSEGPHNRYATNLGAPESSSQSRRASMDEYYTSLFSSRISTAPATLTVSPIDDFESPPSYVAPFMRPRHRLQVLPREDEGREILPLYSASISLDSVLLKKMELVGCVRRAQDREWSREYVSLQGTALIFYKCKSSVVGGVFAKLEKNPDMPTGVKKGTLIKTYNLQHAEAGIAADYTKRRYVIRVRAEADQFLLSCSELGTFVEWLQNIFAAIDLAPPLEERGFPRDQSIPRSRRNGPYRRQQNQGRSGEMRGGGARNANLSANEYAARRRRQRMSQNLAEEDEDQEEDDDEDDGLSDLELDDGEEDRGDSTRNRAASPVISRAASTASTTASRGWTPGTVSPPSRNHALILPPSPQRSRRPPLREISRIQMPNSYYERTQSQPASSNPRRANLSPSTGKWHPIVRHSSTKYDMLYARRCLDILMENSPRKSNLLIMKEKQWIVDWTTGHLTRWGPPEYAEVIGECRGASVRSAEQQMDTQPPNHARSTPVTRTGGRVTPQMRNTGAAK
ncbi:hypothetical protein B7463_g5469, partial [Scytalidium lignicola]